MEKSVLVNVHQSTFRKFELVAAFFWFSIVLLSVMKPSLPVEFWACATRHCLFRDGKFTPCLFKQFQDFCASSICLCWFGQHLHVFPLPVMNNSLLVYWSSCWNLGFWKFSLSLGLQIVFVGLWSGVNSAFFFGCIVIISVHRQFLFHAGKFSTVNRGSSSWKFAFQQNVSTRFH